MNKIATENDVNDLLNKTTAKKLAYEFKQAKFIYKRAISNIVSILLIGVGFVSWPQLSGMISERWQNTLINIAIFAGVIAVISILQSNLHRIWQYRQGGKPDDFNNFFKL